MKPKIGLAIQWHIGASQHWDQCEVLSVCSVKRAQCKVCTVQRVYNVECVQYEVFTVFTTEYVYCPMQCTDSVWQSFTACLRAHNSLLKEQTKLRTQRLTSTLLGKIMNSQSPTEHMSKGTISTYWIYETASYTEHWPFLPRPNVRWEDKLDELGQPQGRVTADSAGYWNSLCRVSGFLQFKMFLDFCNLKCFWIFAT